MTSKHYILLILVPLSEMKALFYNSELKVSAYLFLDNKRFLCNVIEDYSNSIIFGIIFYYLAFIKIDRTIKQICLFLFLLNAFDLIHLGLLDMQFLIPLKLLIAYLLLRLCNRLRIS